MSNTTEGDKLATLARSEGAHEPVDGHGVLSSTGMESGSQAMVVGAAKSAQRIQPRVCMSKTHFVQLHLLST